MILTYNLNLSIGDVLRKILNGHERTCILVDLEGKLYGSITEGDLLRAIWNGISTDSPVDQCINLNPIVVHHLDKSINEKIVLSFIENGILLFPVINDEKKVLKTLSTREVLRGIK